MAQNTAQHFELDVVSMDEWRAEFAAYIESQYMEGSGGEEEEEDDDESD